MGDVRDQQDDQVVKAASTAAVAADPALVVAVSPNTTVRDSDSLGQAQYNFPAGFVRTSDEPKQVFYDPFDAALDTTNMWTTPTVGNSAVLASVTAGTLSMGTGTTASGWSKLSSIVNFKPSVPAWIGYSFAIALPDGAALTANSYRFWGAGTIPAVPTTAAPLTDAVGFEITTAGALVAVVYAGGTRTAVATLTTPTDTAYHRYIVYIRTDRAFWYIDGLTTAVATSSFQSPQIQTLPITMLAVGGSTPPVSNTQITCTGLAVWDTGKNATMISDGTYPHRRVAVSSTGAMSVINTAGLAAGSNVIGKVGIDQTTPGTTNLVALAANQSTNTVQLGGTAIAMNTGVRSTGTQRVTVATDDLVPVSHPTLTKGTQGATGVSTQDLKDAGRVYCNFAGANPVTGVTAEALITLTPYRDLVAGSTGTTFAVTSGKRLRLQALVLTWRNNTAAAGAVIVRLRLLAGTVLVSSPVHASLGATSSSGAAGATTAAFLDLPDGLELSGTMQLGLTQLALGAVVGFDINLIGYEY